MTHRQTLFLSLLLLSAPLPTMAQPAGTFPFGMEKLAWKMSYADVKERLSPSIPEMATAPIGAPHTDQREYFWGPVAWKDCTLQIWTFFANDQLNYIYVAPVLGPVSETCKTAMQDELAAHFGDTPRNEFTSPITHRSMGIVMKWQTPQTIVSYGSAFRGSVILQEAGGPGPVFYDFIGPATSK